MKYFEMLKNTVMNNVCKIENLHWEEITVDNKKEKVGIAYFEGKKDSLSDFIQYKKDFFISKELKQVIEMYTHNIEFDLVMLNNIKEKISKEYYKIEVPKIEGLDEKSTFFKDNTVDKKIINYNKVRNYPIMALKELERTQFSPKHVFVNLDIVESILRRELWGMTFEEVLVEE